MQIAIVTLSPQGQITVPTKIRRNIKDRKFLLEFRDEILLLKPCRVLIEKKSVFSNQVLVEAIIDLLPDEKSVFDVVRKAPCSTDFILEKTQFEISKINVLLTQLEFKGVIRRNRATFLWEAVPLS